MFASMIYPKLSEMLKYLRVEIKDTQENNS